VVARRRGLDCALTEYPYRIGRAWVKINEAPNDFNMVNEWSARRDVPLGNTERDELHAYLEQRRNGKARDKISFQRSGQTKGDHLRQSLRISPGARVALAVPNLTWDASLYESHMAFSSMGEWIIHTVRRFAELYPHDVLIVRAHPGEVSIAGRPAGARVADLLLMEYGASLPANIRFIDSEDRTNTFTLASIAQVHLSYASHTINVELACDGKPQIVAGAAHIRDRGFTVDPETKDEYDRILERLFDLPPMTPEQRELAERYARLALLDYGYDIPLAITWPWRNRHDQEQLFNLSQLLPGRHSAMDAFCAVIAGDGMPAK